MFAGSIFNQPVIIPSNVKNCRTMFEWCKDFDQDIVIPESVTSTEGMFTRCPINDTRIHMASGGALPSDLREEVLSANEDD